MSAGWRGSAGQVRRNCRIRRQFPFFFPGKNPDLGAGSAGLLCRAGGAAGLLEQGAQVGHGGVALALAREFEVYDMVVHSGGAIDLRI